MPQIRVGILTDNRLLGEGLRRILEADPGFTITFGGDPLAIAGAIPADAPQVLLVDGQAGGAFKTCMQLAHGEDRPAVIMIAAEAGEEWAIEAIKAGARGILAKSASPEHLAKAIQVVHEGQIWAQKQVVARALELLSAPSWLGGGKASPSADELTPREQEIVRHTAGGLSNKEISDRMTISQATVKAHLTRIFRKLNVRDRTQLAVLYHDKPTFARAIGLRRSSPPALRL